MKKRHKMSLSHYKLFSCKMGNLVPTACIPVLPGDSIQHAVSAVVRTAPMVGPTMHPCKVKQWTFFVPNRLLWQSEPGDDTGNAFETFITNGPSNDSGLTLPQMHFNAGAITKGSLADYLGILPNPDGAVDVNALPFRALALIWNDRFRDQQIEDKVGFSFGPGAPDVTTNKALLPVNWDKDVTTTARPEPQLGTAVSIPVTGGNQPVIGTGADIPFTNGGSNGPLVDQGGAGPNVVNFYPGAPTVAGNMGFAGGLDIGAEVDFDSVSIDIDDIRQSSGLQHFAENRNRYGSRYQELLAVSFGVPARDSRLQEPELLATGNNTLQFSEVLQTATGAGGTGQPGVGSMFGHGIGHAKGNRYRRFFEEHGYVISLMAIRPIMILQNALDRDWIKQSYLDFFQPELAAMGQQPMMKSEICQTGSTDPTAIFGYQDRYYEYRQMTSKVAGDFRDTLNYLHMARGTDDVTDSQDLTSDFLTCDPTTRIFGDYTADNMWVFCYHSIQARRPVPAIAPLGRMTI